MWSFVSQRLKTTRTAAPPSGSVPQFGHAVMVVKENHSYSEVIGNSAMPYLNSLASQYGLATQYFANTHPSIGNYFVLTTGQQVTNDDGFTGTVGVDNIIRPYRRRQNLEVICREPPFDRLHWG
jgi:hypothetical protein